MADELQSLLTKINEEGIKKAEKEKDKIIEEAKAKAREIVGAAEEKASNIVEAAKKSSREFQERGENAIRQASRDVILALKVELEKRLRYLVETNTGAAMTPEFMAGIIKEMSAKFAADPNAVLEVRTSVKDAEKLEGILKSSLAGTFKAAPKIFPDRKIAGGMEVSFKNGEIFFDFTNEALGELIGEYVGPKLSEFIK